MRNSINDEFSNWYDSAPSEPTYQKAFEAGQAVERIKVEELLADARSMLFILHHVHGSLTVDVAELSKLYATPGRKAEPDDQYRLDNLQTTLGIVETEIERVTGNPVTPSSKAPGPLLWENVSAP